METKIKSVKSKWCNVCGAKVDLRKRKGACELKAEVCRAAGIKNREYHFVCSWKCFDAKWRMS